MPANGSPRSIVVFLVAIGGVILLGGCASLPVSEEKGKESMPTEVEGEAALKDGWIEITLVDGTDAPYAREELHLSLLDPQGQEIHKLCATPDIGENGCKDDVTGAWGVGEAIWAPCLDEGLHRVEIYVLGVPALSDDVTCEHRASAGSSAGDEDGPGQASATAGGVDLDDNGDVEWIKVTLTSGENAPYEAGEVNTSVRDPSDASHDFVCDTAKRAGCEGTEDEFRRADGDEWDVGGNLWIPCQREGTHLVTVSVRGSTVLDSSVSCHQRP